MGMARSLSRYLKAGVLLLGAFVVIVGSLSIIPRTQAATGLIVTNGAGGQGANSWTNPANAQGTADNNTYATAAPGSNARIAGIWNNYNFDFNLPLHAAITKVELIPQYNVSSTLSTVSLEVQAVVGGVNCPSTPVSDSSEPTSDTNFVVDVTTCRTWTRANLLNANFGTRITAFRASSLLGATFSLDYVQVRVTYDTPDYEQAAYRWFDNANSTVPGTVLAVQNTAPTLYAPRDRARLRILLHVTTTSLLTSSEQFKLQFAAKGASCTGLAYTDVTASSLIAYYGNPAPADGAAITTGGTDPSHSGHANIAQSYAESSPISTLANVSVGQDALWDISLVGNGAAANTTYCFRMVKNDGTALTAYTVYPEIVTSPTGTLNVDIVDDSGNPVASPSFSFSNLTAPINCSTTTATLSTNSQRIRVKNTTDTPGWSLSIAATSGSAALWSAGTPTYDFNDSFGSPAGCSDGGDSDSRGGQMTIDPFGGTITPRAVTLCSTSGVTKGSSSSFIEGSLNAITLMNSSGANTGCFWELTNINVSQTVPGSQTPGSYSINMTLTVVAN